MSFLRKSKPTPTPAEQVNNLMSKKKPKVLAASTTAIALTISSAFSDTQDAPGDGGVVPGNDSAWKTAYGAAKMAVEVAKESSDMFPPLKAVAGAMSVLIRNYDVRLSVMNWISPHPDPAFLFQQTSDNADTMKGIEQRVQSLSGVLASPVSKGDFAEKGRRVVLQMFVLSCVNICQFAYPALRKLKAVIAKLEPLTEQHSLIGFFCNVDNATILAGFIQELADAITDYQVWATCPVMIHDEHPPRFQSNKGYTQKQRASTMIPGKSLMTPRTSAVIPRISW